MSLIKFTLNQIWRLRENRSMLQLWWVSVIDPDSVQPQRTPVRILILDCSFLGVIINDRPAERASAQSARSLPHTFEMRREMTHQTLVTASWLPLVCSEHSWKLLWRAHDLFNTCWCIFHKNSLNASVPFTGGKGLLQQRFWCVILSEHFHSFNFVLQGTDRFQI